MRVVLRCTILTTHHLPLQVAVLYHTLPLFQPKLLITCQITPRVPLAPHPPHAPTPLMSPLLRVYLLPMSLLPHMCYIIKQTGIYRRPTHLPRAAHRLLSTPKLLSLLLPIFMHIISRIPPTTSTLIHRLMPLQQSLLGRHHLYMTAISLLMPLQLRSAACKAAGQIRKFSSLHFLSTFSYSVAFHVASQLFSETPSQ